MTNTSRLKNNFYFMNNIFVMKLNKKDFRFFKNLISVICKKNSILLSIKIFINLYRLAYSKLIQANQK
jgi:hypothetical protein